MLSEAPTRYSGEHWDRTASDLFCGVADSIQDVGLVFIGQTWDASEKAVTIAEASLELPLSRRNVETSPFGICRGNVGGFSLLQVARRSKT